MGLRATMLRSTSIRTLLFPANEVLGASTFTVRSNIEANEDTIPKMTSYPKSSRMKG